MEQSRDFLERVISWLIPCRIPVNETSLMLPPFILYSYWSLFIGLIFIGRKRVLTILALSSTLDMNGTLVRRPKRLLSARCDSSWFNLFHPICIKSFYFREKKMGRNLFILLFGLTLSGKSVSVLSLRTVCLADTWFMVLEPVMVHRIWNLLINWNPF